MSTTTLAVGSGSGRLPMRVVASASRDVRSIGELLRVRSRERPDHPMLRWRGSTYMSYQDADRETDKLASGLAALGVGQGDRVALLTPNCPEFLLIWLAAAKI